jgi:hypothetical protein
MPNKFETIHNKLAELFLKQPDLVNGSNDDVVDAYRDKFDREGERTPSESITRAWRKGKEQGLWLSSPNIQKDKYRKEEEFRKHYGEK